MPQDDLDKKIQEAQRIYSEAMAKLAELQAAHQQILASAKRRVEKEEMNKIRQGLN